MSKLSVSRWRVIALLLALIAVLAAGCVEPEPASGQQSQSLTGPIPQAPVCSDTLTELDANVETTARYLPNALPAEIDTVIQEGLRPFRLSANGGGRFSAVLVPTDYTSRPQSWIEYDLTEAELQSRAENLWLRVMDVAPLPPGSIGLMPSDPRYAAIIESRLVSKSTLQLNSATQVLLRATLAEVAAADGRVIDLEVEGTFIGDPSVAAVVLTDLCSPIDQWVGSGSSTELSTLLSAGPDRRVLALDHVVGFDDRWVYVVEERPSAVRYPFWYADLQDLGNPGHASDLSHVLRRHRGRYTDLKSYRTQTGELRYLATGVDNGELPVSGPEPPPELSAVDDAFRDFLRRGGAPGGTLAIMDGSTLVFARGYGYRDLVTMEAMSPRTLLRMASVSKVITGLAILRLIDAGALAPESGQPLTLDTRAFAEVLPPPASPGANWSQLSAITIRQLLAHRSGFGRNSEYIQNLSPSLFVEAFDDHEDPFPCASGTYCYSNSNYHVLGHVIERVSGLSYEQYACQKVLEPLGLHQLAITRSLPASSACIETRNYDVPGLDEKLSQWGNPDNAAWGFTGQASGGWAASAVDLARLGATFSNILSAQSDADIHADNLGFTGCGWGPCLDKSGGFPVGTLSYLRAEHRGRWSYFWVTNAAPLNATLGGALGTLLVNTLPTSPNVSGQLPSVACKPFVAARPDLVVTAVSVSDSTPLAGSSVTVNFKIENRGTAPAPATIAWASAFQSRPLSLPTTFAIQALAQGERSAMQSFTFTTSAVAGTYTYNISADPGNQVAELVETNNTANGSVTSLAY